MRLARSSIAGFALLVAAQAPAAEGSAPLESTKRELEQLQAAQKNKSAPVTADGVKIATPTLDAQAVENPVIQQWTDRKKSEERVEKQKQRKSENWLLNGMEQLEKEGTAATATTTDAITTGESPGTTVDASDPGYLLKLFDEQKKQTDGKEAAARPRPTPGPDPFAPFLQSWLGNSPVRGQVMDQLRNGNETAGAPVVAGRPEDFRGPEAAAFSGVAVPTSTPGSLPAAPKPNPYLVDLAPLSSPAKDVSAGSAPLAGIDRALTPAGPAPATPLIAPLPEARAPMKGPPPSPADDKKYFPQLNKF
jgi:hypothetical protein